MKAIYSGGEKIPVKDLGDLQIFAKVASTRSMSESGRILGLSPAVVSKAIKRLETSLGVRLLQRTTRQIAVTETGQAFYERVIEILASVQEAENFVSGRSAEIAGELRVSAPTSFGRMHVAPHLRGFMELYPNVSVELVLSDAFTDIISEGYDLAIRISALKDSGLVARKLAATRRILCASPEYLERFGVPKTMRELANHTCLPAHNGEPWRLEGPEGSLTYRPEGKLKTNSSEVIREAVISGLGIALRSTWDIGTELSTGRLVQVLPGYEGPQNTTVSAVYPSRQFIPPKVRAFSEHLQRIYGSEPYWETTGSKK